MLGDKEARAQNLRLRSAREQRGWSQKQVAAAVGTNAVMVSRWECGVMRPGPHFRQALCSLYGRTPEELGFVAAAPPAAAPAAPSRSDAWCVPLRRNGYFTGRDEVLRRLHETLRTGRVPQAICGLAGIGKTQTALEYACRWRETYGAVLWADATSHESLTADFVSFAEALGLPASPDEESRAVVGGVLSWLGQTSDWLLVLDNVDELATAEPFIPHGDGSVILTMRAQASGTVAESVELVAMADEDAVLFLLRRAKVVAPDGRLEDAPDFEREAAARIASAFGGLPLALDQAGAYVEETACGLAGYLARYRTQQDELLGRRGVQALDHPLSIAATLALTLRQVEGADPAAADVLRLTAFLNPDGIPEELFGGGAVPALTDPLAFDSALEALRRYSLVRRDRATRTVSVHRLVQTVVRGSMDQEERALWAMRAVAAIERELPDLQTATWRGVQRYTRQAHQGATLVEEWELESPPAARVLDQLGAYLRECARYTEAESLLLRALAMREALLGPEHPLTAATTAHLARVALDVGRYGHAAELYSRALSVRERVLGPAHADTADAMVGLANAYYQQGTYADAEALWLRALAVQEDTIGPDHAQTAYTLNTLAMLYRTLGRGDEAEPLLRRALAIREHTLGADHPRVGMVLNNLAVVLADDKRYGEAEACYRRALSLYEQALGPDHAEVATTLHNLAGVHCDRGEAGVAEGLYRRSLAIRERTLGPDDPTIAFHLASLANVLQKEGRLDEAHATATRALNIWRRTVGGGHASVARALSVLARVAAGRRNVAEAAGLFHQALDISRRMLGPEHSGTRDLEAEYLRLTGGGHHPESFRGSVRTLAAYR
jgi:tetratricopeptide (TPR) repeat protein/transcriptional regulator with XRE-family HTH domain